MTDFSIDYERELNTAQLAAVCAGDGPVLVIAGAGSGKTRTLTYRVARLVESGVAPDSILLLTFTRKASAEMLRRAALLLDSRCDDVSGGTFHSFSHLLLRRYGSRIGIPPRFAVMDRSDCEALVDRAVRKILPKKPARGFPRKGTIADIISASANRSLTLRQVLADDYPHFLRHEDVLEAIHQGYITEKSEQGLLDFDDLLLFARNLLASEDGVREAVSHRYSHIMVDEYQDTNLIQADILRHLASTHKNVMAVGDDCQSIYSFRGANFENIMRFPEVFPGTRIIRLEQNYRSTQPILSLTNRIVSAATRKYAKKLYTEITGGETPLLVQCAGEKSQSVFIVDEILNMARRGTPLSDIAVLFRAGYHAFDLEVELARSGISYVKYGGYKFMESAHVKDLLAHLRVAAYPGDRISWARILILLDHVGARTADKVTEKIVGGGGIGAIKPGASWAAGWKRLSGLLANLKPEKDSVTEMAQKALTYYEPVLKDRHDNWPKRMKDLEQLLEMTERYDSLTAFLSDMALEPPTDSVNGNLSADREHNQDRLILSTVHSAKGLEWGTVFILFALDGRFPAMQAVVRQGDAIEEELRLMYVAATRAKEKLYFTYPTDIYDHSSGSFLYRPSRFIADISEETLSRLRC